MADAKCPKCEGTGWRPIETNGVRQVTRCDCYVTDRTTRLLQAARIPRRYEHCSFENFANSRKIQMLAEAHLVAQRYCEEYPLDYGLLFVGPTGVKMAVRRRSVNRITSGDGRTTERVSNLGSSTRSW